MLLLLLPPLVPCLSPTLVRVHPPSVSLPLLVPVPPLARSCCSRLFVAAQLFARLAFMWPPFALVCAHSVECLFVLIPTTQSHLFGLCLAFIHGHSHSFAPACLCALICGSLLSCYTRLAFIWPSFVLVHAQPLVYVYIKYTISTYMLINTLTFIA